MGLMTTNEIIDDELDSIIDFTDENDELKGIEDLRDALDEFILTDDEVSDLNKADLENKDISLKEYKQIENELSKDGRDYYDSSKEVDDNRLCTMPASISTLRRAENLYKKFIVKYPNALYQVDLLLS